jgi:subtilisin family serine protease
MASPHVAGTVALCIASGPCAGLTSAQIIQKIVSDAAAYNTANPSYGAQEIRYTTQTRTGTTGT